MKRKSGYELFQQKMANVVWGNAEKVEIHGPQNKNKSYWVYVFFKNGERHLLGWTTSLNIVTRVKNDCLIKYKVKSNILSLEDRIKRERAH